MEWRLLARIPRRSEAKPHWVTGVNKGPGEGDEAGVGGIAVRLLRAPEASSGGAEAGACDRRGGALVHAEFGWFLVFIG